MSKSGISWTDFVWNPVTGCTPISPGCANCYAKDMAKRLQAIGQEKYSDGFKVTLHEDLLNMPKKRKKPTKYFVNSMSDLFHEDVPVEFIQKVFTAMKETPWHTFQILTKRTERLFELSRRLPWPKNVWQGVTVENADYLYRLDHLRAIPAKVRFVSMEPLIGPLPDLDLTGIHWVILGGESGRHARPMEKEWLIPIRFKCLNEHIPFFFKQWSDANPQEDGALLDNRIWNAFPEN